VQAFERGGEAAGLDGEDEVAAAGEDLAAHRLTGVKVVAEIYRAKAGVSAGTAASTL